jgi:hypothetical protein
MAPAPEYFAEPGRLVRDGVAIGITGQYLMDAHRLPPQSREK